MHDPLVRDFRSLGGKIALLGGTFDPVHKGHLAMGETILAKTGADAVVFVPVRQNPLKANPPVASDADRVEMLKRGLLADRRMFVSTIETEREGISYTVDTLRQVKGLARMGAELMYVCGADQLESFHKWRDVEGILSLATVYVLGRDGITAADVDRLASALPAETRKVLADNFIPFSLPAAATNIRNSLQAGQAPAEVALLTPEVASYIESHGLYRERRKN